MKIKKGDIVLINFDPSIGNEIKKTRPAVVIQNNIANKYSPLVTVVPCTSRIYKDRVFEHLLIKDSVNKLDFDSVVFVNQIMTFDKRRLIKVIGQVSSKDLECIHKKVLIHLGWSEEVSK